MDVTNRKQVITTSAGPSSYTTGGFNISINDLATVDNAYVIQTGGGYTAEVVSVTGNVAKVKVYSSAGTEVTSGTDLSGINVVVLAFSL